MATVIIVMQMANLLAISMVLIFAKKYQGNFCPYHKALQSESLDALKDKSGLGTKM
jgi:hypothetical protein